jgi:hypothetical protein
MAFSVVGPSQRGELESERSAVPTSGVLEPWAFGIGRFRLGHPGKTLALHNAPHELFELRPTAEAMEFARFLR